MRQHPTSTSRAQRRGIEPGLGTLPRQSCRIAGCGKGWWRHIAKQKGVAEKGFRLT